MSRPLNSCVEVPILESERLKLRGHRLDDSVHSAAMWADPEVTRYIGGKPLTEEESWARLLRYVGHWSLLGFGYWLVEEKMTGNFIGEVGFADYKRDLPARRKSVGSSRRKRVAGLRNRSRPRRCRLG